MQLKFDMKRTISDTARVWIYQSSRLFTDEEVAEIEVSCNQFVISWAAHGKDVHAAFQVIDNLFIILIADDTGEKPSGCSIDSSLHYIDSVEKKYNIVLKDRINVAIETDAGIVISNMNDVKNLIDSENIKESNIMFDNTITTYADFVSNWKKPINKSWLNRLL